MILISLETCTYRQVLPIILRNTNFPYSIKLQEQYKCSSYSLLGLKAKLGVTTSRVTVIASATDIEV